MPQRVQIILFSIFLVEGVGFEPTKSFRTPDLQSGGFNHSPIPPDITTYTRKVRTLYLQALSVRYGLRKSPRGDSNP